jgi:signal transduction histidine kinase
VTGWRDRLAALPRRLDLRTRLIAVGTAGLALGLALGGVLLVGALDHAVRRGGDADALDAAGDLAALITADALPEVVPVTGGHVVQVVDGSHRVLAASLGADRLVPLLTPRELDRAGVEPVTVDAERIGETGPLRVLVRPVGAGSGVRVVVATRVGDTRRSAAALRGALLVSYPALVGVLAVLGWRMVGATLRPVAELRAGAERITGTGGSTRLPVPASRDEIHRLAVTLNGMLDRIASAQARQRAFVADAAHELRSPLASLRTQLEVAERIGEPAPVADLLLDLERLTRLVDDLLLLARSDEAGTVPDLRPVDPVDLVAELVRSRTAARVPVSGPAGGPVGDQGRVVTGRPDAGSVPATPVPPVPPVLADPFLLRRVLSNLVDNAVRFARTEVRLDVGTDGDRVLLCVSDDGPGIPARDRDRVFERFTRLDAARSHTGDGTGPAGAGLGLAIVRELVRLHRGEVRLADAGPGLRVEVRLPTAPG